jgi:hypothetical protein
VSTLPDTQDSSTEQIAEVKRTGAMECPAWCEIDHSRGDKNCVGSGGSPGLFGPNSDSVWTRALRRVSGQYMVAVTGAGESVDKGGHLSLAPYDAEHMAALVELLAEATPDQHRELAALIRLAAVTVRETEASTPSQEPVNSHA